MSGSAPTEVPRGSSDVVLLARQPIFESSWQVHGYELLFRCPEDDWRVDDEAAAAAQVLVGAFADVSVAVTSGEARAWVAVPRELLLAADVSCVLPRERVVLELPARSAPDDELLERARQLAEQGYDLALDGFCFDEERAALLALATYVKLDVRTLGLTGLADQTRRLTGCGARLIAAGVETETEHAACVQLGIGLHQGPHLERPRLLTGRPTPHQAISGLRAVAALGSTATFEDVEAFLRRDPGLSVRLLRWLGSAAVGLRHRVTSLSQALALAGVRPVRQWLLLVMLSELGTARPELLRTGLVRARLCEMLAPTAKVRPESAFLVGLLSICDALFDVELEALVTPLPLAADVRDALLSGTGGLGTVLARARAVQAGVPAADGRDPRALLDALRWADAQIAALAAPLN